jgi:WD40 repeat protein
MSATWKTVRVFISSTFRDMQAERDHLVRVVFPELRERCAKRHLHLVDVDLRWGVTEEDAQRGKALEICLREIEDCRPFFIGLLGERYGWIPPRYDIPDEAQFDSLRAIELGHSITAMEIYQGVLNNPQMRTHAFFYFRDPAFIDTLPPEKQPDFRAEDDEHTEKLRKLKDRIRASNLPVREDYRYDDLDEFGRQVLEDLWSAIETEHPEEAPEADPLDAERAYHDFFIETRTGLFIGQRHLLARLYAYATSDSTKVSTTSRAPFWSRFADCFRRSRLGRRSRHNQRLPGESQGRVIGPMVVSGLPGCGKSALLARFVSQCRRLQPETFILYHFVGASPSSTDPRQMLLRLCQELARRFEFEDEIPQDYNELRVRFWQFCQRASERGPWVLVLDALNQLDETYRTHELDWLPALVPPRLRLILSSLEGDTLRTARQKYQQRQDVIVTSLRLVDQGFIIAKQLKAARKSLSTARDWRRQWRMQHGDPWQLTDPTARERALDAERQQERSQLRFILTGVATRHREPTPRQTIVRETANPLYLKLVAEELRLFGDYDRLAEFIAQLPTDAPGMFHTVLGRLEGDHGRELVEHSLSLVATGRHGLLEGELLELLARPGEERFPMSLWSRLYRGLAFYFKPRASVKGGDEGLLDFFHQQLAKAVRGRYLGTDHAQRDRHAELAGYFRRKGDPGADETWKGNYPRSLSELIHHQVGGHLWDGVETTLSTLPFLEANGTAGRTFDLANAFSAAVTALPKDRPQRRILRLLQEALRRDIHFITRHAQDYPQGLFQCLWNSCWWYDSLLAAEHYAEPEGGWKGRPPWQRSGPRLSELLERWREGREHTLPGFRWLRSLRPPQIQLGMAQLAVLRGHEDHVNGVSCSPDGRRIASGSGRPSDARDTTVRVWDAQNGKELAVLRGHEKLVTTVSWSPDGRHIVSGSEDSTLRVWDAERWAELAVLRGQDSVSYSPDGLRLVSGSDDKTARVWDAQSGAELAVLRGHEGDVNSVSYSPDGRRIASGSDDKTVRLWDAQNGAEWVVLHGHKASVRSVSYSPDGRRIVSGSDDKKVRVWGAHSGAKVAVLPGHEGNVNSVSYSPDGRRIVSGSDDKTVRVWDAESGAVLAVLRGHLEKVTTVSYSADGQRIVSGSWDGTVRVWDAESTMAQLAILCGHRNYVNGVSYSPDGRRIASGSEDSTLRLWDAQSWAELAVLRGQDSFSYSPDGLKIAGGSHDGTVRVWDAQSGKELHVLRGHEGDVNSVSYSPDGRRIASGSGDKTVRVWDAQSGKELHVLREHEGAVNSVSYSPDGRRIASGSGDKAVRVWDAQSGKELRVLRGHEGAVNSVSYSPDGWRIVSGSDDKTVRVWDTDSDTEVTVLPGHQGSVNSVSCSPDGRRIVSGSDDTTLRVWDAESGAKLAVWRGHLQKVTSVSYSPDGRRIVSGSWDGTVRVWDAESTAETAVLRGHDDRVTNVSYSSDGRWIVSGSDDKPVRLWDARSGAELAVFAHEESDRSVSYSPDGRQTVIKVAFRDHTVRVSDAERGAELAVLRVNKPIGDHHVLRSPDGRGIDSVSWDTSLQERDAERSSIDDLFLAFFRDNLPGMRDHYRDVTCLSISLSRDCQRLVSGSRDGTVRLWDAQSGAEAAILRGHDRDVTYLSWSADGQRIVSGSRDGAVRLWDAQSGECLRVVQSAKDVAAIVAEFKLDPSRALMCGLETVIVPTLTAQPAAWFADRLSGLCRDPSGPRWAGGIGNYLCLISLEGADESGGASSLSHEPDAGL